MALHNKLGADGETFACNYLEENGYKILHRNWRFNHKELDIVALDGHTLVFIEVKTRTANNWENPRDAITNAKIKYLADAAEAYICHFDYHNEARFDVLTLVTTNGGFETEHIREAFHP
jgi:putative endonuclease